MSGILKGLLSARSAIRAHGRGISVLADNIANQNTPGFKASRAEFSDLLLGSLSGTSQIGSGSMLSGVTPMLTQGSFEFTARGLDLGIAGNGFFVVEDPSGAQLYTRVGNFEIDAAGYLVDANGYHVLGFPSGSSGGLQALNLGGFSQGAAETSLVAVSGNLDASSPLVPPASLPTPGVSTFSEYEVSAALSTQIEVYDSLGQAHTVSTYFYHTANTPTPSWNYRVVVDAGETGGPAGIPDELASGNLSFQSDGTRTLPLPASDATLNPAWVNGASASSIDLSFSAFTQFSSASYVSSVSQDGLSTGSVQGFTVRADGTLEAVLSNGQNTSVGRVALASFANSEGLLRTGDSHFARSSTSGEVVLGTAGDASFGGIESGVLEGSNVDVAADFIRQIRYSRGFQGNSRIISRLDELLEEIIGLG